MTRSPAKKPASLVSETEVQRYSELVYRDRLGPDDTRRVLAKEGGAAKISRDCVIYKPLVRSLLTILAQERASCNRDPYGALVELVRCVRGGDETAGISMDDALLDADAAIEKARNP